MTLGRPIARCIASITRAAVLPALIAMATLVACERPTAPAVLVYADRPLTLPSTASGWRSVSVGGGHSCGIRVDGQLACWGNGRNGQLGVGTPRGQCGRRLTACEGGPRYVNAALRFTKVSAGERHSCALTVDGALVCWGESSQYQTGVEGAALVPTPTPVLPALRFVDVAAGSTHSCAVRTTGEVYCWGEGRLGALGRGDTVTSVIPRPIVSSERFVSVGSGRWRSCAISIAGALWCWGAQWERSESGLDYFHERLVPMRVQNAPSSKQVSVSGSSICGVAVDAGAYCFEANSFAQLGIGTTDGTLIPTMVASPEALVQVSAGIVQGCGLTARGAALCWGNDTFGQLGIPRTGEFCGVGQLECRRSPAPVFGALRFLEVQTGLGSHSCGVTVQGAIACWGLGGDGQLGDGWTRDRQSLPVGVLAPVR